jgi:hypothetical protein
LTSKGKLEETTWTSAERLTYHHAIPEVSSYTSGVDTVFNTRSSIFEVFETILLETLGNEVRSGPNKAVLTEDELELGVESGGDDGLDPAVLSLLFDTVERLVPAPLNHNQHCREV